ncbi:ABC transporter ATP-binding protein [Favolaschia claudopus]|uniref:ABC transporter ATP-binding protein n=1 Tax=Favolaschia claudopus TaxID=2862362 RepID=A0AAW0DAL6_9AGAR
MEQKTELPEAGKHASESVEELRLGVWRIFTERETRSLVASWKQFTVLLPIVRKFVLDVYSLGPRLLFLLVLSKVWFGVEDVLLLHFANKLLALIEVGLREGRADTAAVVNAIIGRVVVVAVSACIGHWGSRISPILHNRCVHHFEDLLFSSNLKTDMPTIQANDIDLSLSATPAWNHFENLLELMQTGVQTVILCAYIFRLSSSSQLGPLFVLLCLAQPFLRSLSDKRLWGIAHVLEAIDANYVRLRALKELENDKYRQDILSGNISNYLINEFDRSCQELKDKDMGSPYGLFQRNQSVNFAVAIQLAGDLTMLYYALNAVFNSREFTLTSIAMLQHSESLLRRSFQTGMRELGEGYKGMMFMKRIYDAANVENIVRDGVLEYPRDGSDAAGMSIDLRNVSFVYPGSKSKVKALENVTLSIKSGQLVVLVGANGSGKSTLVKLLARLYDVTSGQVLVNGEDIREYKIRDIRAATASLTQDHHLYPVSLTENIGLGHPSSLADPDMVNDAAGKGGADAFISKLPQGFSTVLDPQNFQYTSQVTRGSEESTRPLVQEANRLVKKIDVSGGERQRVVASRTFMRFNSGKVKLVIADEGSSTLDPKGEWELFKNLRAERQGKTMVLVTHRFGHLTKYADLMLCMKEGHLVETGTHEELMQDPDGEYRKLYDLQANAFST